MDDHQMDDRQCIVCKKGFTRESDLQRHVQQVHKKIKTHECGICHRQFARKQHKEWHLRICSRKVQGDGVAVQKNYVTTRNLQFTPIFHTSIFGGIFAEWYIKIPTDYYLINPVVLLEEAFRSFKDIITKHLYDHTKKLKYIMSAHVIFQQGVDPEIKTEPPVVLTVNPVTVYIATDLDKELQESAREMMVLMENYEGVGSGWVYDYITRLDISLNSF